MHIWNQILSVPIVSAETRPCDLDRLEELLLAANRACALECLIENAGAIAVCLSGGLDSSTSVAMIRRAFPGGRIAAYTIGSDESHPDVVHAAEVADRFGLAHRVVIPTAKDEAAADDDIPSSIGVHVLYRFMRRDGVRSVIAHDGIDELLGGYWAHREWMGRDAAKALEAFTARWGALESEHLQPLEATAEAAGIRVRFPYLKRSVVEEIAAIPLEERTSREVSKMPLRAIASRYGVPESVIRRKKIGFCDALTSTRL